MNEYAAQAETEVPQTPKPKGPGLLDQVVGVYTDPSALFDRLRETPSWIGPMALFIVLNVVVAFLWTRHLDLDGYLMAMLERAHLPANTNLDHILEVQKQIFVPMNLAGALFGVPILILIMAFLFWLVGKAAAATAPTFPQALSAWMAPLLVALPKSALMVVMCAAKHNYIVDADKLSPTSLGFFIHPENPKLQTLLYALDPFTFIQMFLVVLALKRVLRYRPAAAWAVVVVPYVSLMAYAILKAA